MNQKHTRASTMIPALGLCVAALAVAFAGSASAAPGTTRVIVAFKPGTAANVKSAVAAARGRSSWTSST
jgi:hypothetical protein